MTAHDHRPAGSTQATPDPRVWLAAERTLLAWIRTGLALMGFGFVVARFGLFLRELAAGRVLPIPQTQPSQASASQSGLAQWVGIALIVTGVLVNLLAPIQHALFLRQLARGNPRRPRALTAGSLLAMLLAVLGIVLAVYLLVMR